MNNSPAIIILMFIAMISPLVGAQAQVLPAQVSNPSAAPAPAPAALSQRDAALRVLWTALHNEFADGVIDNYRRKFKNLQQRALLEDASIRQAIKAKFYERFAKVYGESLTLEEINYLGQLYSTNLMKRTSEADKKIWQPAENFIVAENVLIEAMKKLPPVAPVAKSAPVAPLLPSVPVAPATSSVPTPVYPKTAPRK